MHNINTYIGREAAWHKLGTVTGHYMTWEEILTHGGLDFQVFKSQLLNGRSQKIEAFGIFRWDKKTDPSGENTIFLGTCGKDYKVIHHSKGFEMLDALVSAQNGAHYETAGVLGKGEVVWGQLNLNMTIHVGDDIHIPRVLFHTSHDMSMKLGFRMCDERVVCSNTLQMALSEKGRKQLSFKHTKNGEQKMIDAKEALSALASDVKTIEDKFNFLAQRAVTKESLDSIVARLFPPTKKEESDKEESSTRRDNILTAILQTYEANDRDAFPEQRGTAYNLLNAITNYTDHQRSTRGNGRAESAMFGSGNELKTDALEIIMEAANGMPAMNRAVSYAVKPIPKLPPTPVGLYGTVLDDILAVTEVA